MSTAAVTTQDPLVRAFSSLARWHRGRQLVLGAMLGALVLQLWLAVAGSVLQSASSEEVGSPWSPMVARVSTSPDRVWADMGVHWRRHYDAPQLAPRIQMGDGTWHARDLMGLHELELRVDAEPESVEAALRTWAARICTPDPRPLYLIELDPQTMDELSPLLVDACPTLVVYRVHFLAIPIF